MSKTNNAGERKTEEMERRESDRQLRLLVESMGDMVSRHLPNSTVTCISPLCRDSLGPSQGELPNTLTGDYVLPDD